MTGETFRMIRLGVQKLSSGNLDGGRKKLKFWQNHKVWYRWGMPNYYNEVSWDNINDFPCIIYEYRYGANASFKLSWWFRLSVTRLKGLGGISLSWRISSCKKCEKYGKTKTNKLFNSVEKGSSCGDPVMWSGFDNAVVTQTWIPPPPPP